MSERLMVLASLEGEVEPGRMREFPPHLTIVPWFDLSQDLAGNLEQNLFVLANRTKPLEIIGEDEAYFARNGEARVRRLGDVAMLRRFHHEVVAITEVCGGQFVDETYMNAHYNPHVSAWDGGSFAEGERVTLTHLQLAGKDKAAHPLTRQIIRNFKLQG